MAAGTADIDSNEEITSLLPYLLKWLHFELEFDTLQIVFVDLFLIFRRQVYK